jgi:hypothetical protein
LSFLGQQAFRLCAEDADKRRLQILVANDPLVAEKNVSKKQPHVAVTTGASSRALGDYMHIH